jgi:uncharacterized membrane protein YgaE (UPF0421/DUF939 family)
MELNIDNIPFNPDCWARKSLPTRHRYDHLCNKQSNINKNLQKIVKYLQKIPSLDISKEEATLEELRILVEKREYYENTYLDKERELLDWTNLQKNGPFGMRKVTMKKPFFLK